jgi:hypothetical protein
MSVLTPYAVDVPARRWKLLRITPECIFGLCRIDGKIKGEGMPVDARHIRSYVEDARTICIVVESESFDEVQDGRYLPEMTVNFTQSYD